MDLRELRLILRRHAVVAMAAFAVCVLLGMGASFLPDKTYETTATIVLSVPPEQGSTVQQITFATPALAETAESRSMRTRAAEDVPEELRGTKVTIKATADSSVFRIHGTSGSPVAAQAWVNAVANRLIEETAAAGTVRLSLLDEAPLKRRAASPNVEPILLGGVVLGLIAAVFAALLADRARSAFDSGDTVRERVGATVLGEIPNVRELAKHRRSLTALLTDDTQRELVAAFETIRTGLELRLANTQASTVAVVSYSAGAGRSTVAAGVGIAMAAVGREVVLLEGDLRNPSLSDKLEVNPGRGLGGMAVLGSEVPQLQSTLVPRLHLLGAGVPAGRAADVVTTMLPKALQAVAAPGRVVLIDTPAQEAAPESAVAASLSGHVLLVVNSSPADFFNLPAAITRIQDSGAILLGVVINRVPRRRLSRGDQRQSTVRPVMGTRPLPEREIVLSEPPARHATNGGGAVRDRWN